MITLTRLSGSVFALNSDLIERVDATPDTVVTLVDGKKYVVTESLDEVVDAVRRHRGEVLALSTYLETDGWGRAPGSHAGAPPSTPRSTPPRLGTVSEHPASRGRIADRIAGTES